ncbi:MAG TPA: hypothetical protein VIV11_10720 [Kofleriaceae bacterium]
MRCRLASAVALSFVAAAACTGAVDGSGDDGMGGGGGGDGTGPDASMPAAMVDITGPDVLPHVQLFANAMCAATTACTIGTRTGHHPSAERAIDILVSDVYGEVPSDNNALGDKVAQFTLAHQAEFGVWYTIWRQRYNDGSGWDPMEDRGSITQNHYDHVHVSFDATLP